MPKSYITVDETSDEVTFIKALIHAFINNPAIVSAGHIVTCDKTDAELDTIYAGDERPIFRLMFDNSASLEFKRADADEYSVRLFVGQTDCLSGSFWFTDGVHAKSTVTQRKCLVQIYSNSNVISINIGNYNQTFPLKRLDMDWIDFLIYTEKENGTVSYCVAGDTSNIFDSSGNLGGLANRLNYIKFRDSITDVDVIEDKVIYQYTRGASPSTSVLKKFKNLWDSSWFGKSFSENLEGLYYPVNVSGRTCVYLDNYTLMPI